MSLTETDRQRLYTDLERVLGPASAEIIVTHLTPADAIATKADLADLESRMATKTDLADLESRMATKTDLADLESRMATKADIADLEMRMATKADIADLEMRMATKTDLADIESRMATKADIASLETRIVVLETGSATRMASVEKDLERLYAMARTQFVGIVSGFFALFAAIIGTRFFG